MPGAVALLAFVVWAAKDGGFDPLVWIPWTLFLLFVLVASAALLPGRFEPSVSVAVALAALTAFTAWNYASMVWAGSRSTAWEGANKTLLYLVVYAIFVLRPWRGYAATVLVGAFVSAIALVGLVTYLRATVAEDPLGSFIAGRLAAPIAYSNANCALFMASFWPALWLASRRETHPVARAGLLASAGVSAELALMSQSRGSLVAVPLTLAVYFAVVPGRLRSIVVLLPVGAAVWLSAPRVLDVYDAVVSGEGVRETLVDARTAIVWSAAALLVAGALVGAVDRLVVVPRAVVRIAAVVVACTVAAGAVGAAVAVEDRYGDPSERLDEWWTSFKSGRYVYEPETPHLVSGLGSGRYDIWRVAAITFERRPIVGIGSDNFLADYLVERRRLDDPLNPHSLPLRVVSQVGVVGAAALTVFLVAAFVPAVRTRLRGDARDAGLAAALGVSVGYWLIHGSVDWFWEVPALAAPAFAFLGVAGRLVVSSGDAQLSRGPLPVRGRLLATAALAAAAILAAALLVPPWLAARDVDAAVGMWRTDPRGAFDRLERASRLDPWDDEPYVYTAVIATQLGQTARKRAALQRALRRNPANWYVLVELGALESRAGRRAAALAWLRRAEAANPLEPIVDFVRAEVTAGRTVSERTIERLMIDRVDLLVGKRQG